MTPPYSLPRHSRWTREAQSKRQHRTVLSASSPLMGFRLDTSLRGSSRHTFVLNWHSDRLAGFSFWAPTRSYTYTESESKSTCECAWILGVDYAGDLSICGGAAGVEVLRQSADLHRKFRLFAPLKRHLADRGRRASHVDLCKMAPCPGLSQFDLGDYTAGVHADARIELPVCGKSPHTVGAGPVFSVIAADDHDICPFAAGERGKRIPTHRIHRHGKANENRDEGVPVIR